MKRRRRLDTLANMNASPSAQSVGSAKPSTAVSSASAKRARTIIVARDLRENATPTAASAASNRQHKLPRDEKTGRLSSYAALGSEEDVALYERFLAEKYPPPAGGARHAVADRGATDSAHQTATMATTAHADAKKRREAAVQQRKWLMSLPIHERLAYEREQNALKKWKKINREWEEFKARTSKKLGKSEKQLVMSRAAEYREQVEMYDALQRAMPLSEKVAGDFWLVTLRNDGTRYVPVGNIFSGLYCPIRESSKLQPRVRRPLDYLDGARKEEPEDVLAQVVTREKPLSSLERRSLEALARKKRRLKKQLEALFPHEVEPSQSGQLKVDTVDLFEWAAASRGDEDDDQLGEATISHTSSSRSLLLPLTEETNGGVMDSGCSSVRSRRSDRPATSRTGPSFRLILDAASEVNVVMKSEKHEQQYGELSFFTDIDVMQQEVIYLENDGSAALHFLWRRVDVRDDEITPRLTQSDPSPASEPERMTWTSISKMRGVIFPGERLEFVFSFQSKRSGVWLEEWHLDVDPPIPALVREHGHTAAAVRLHCTAIDNFVPFTKLAQLAKRVEKAETQFMAEQVLKSDVIRKVDPTYPIEFLDLSDAARSFYDAHRGGEFESVQYSERFIRECHALYAHARVLVVSPAADQEEEAPSADGADTSTRTPQVATSNLDDARAYPIAWDLQLSSLEAVAAAADAKLSSEYASLKAQLVPTGPPQEEEDEEEDEDDLMERVLGTKARKREEEQVALRALEPHFMEDFNSLCLAAHISPYEPRLLTETLADKLADMASETSVVVDIARMQADDHTDGIASAYEMLRPLLIRALDESLAVDQQHERVFEHAKRKFQSIVLDEKVRSTELPRLITADSLAGQPRQVSVVIFMQLDLDVANWYSLEPKSSENPALEWKLTQKLLDHETYVPPKVLAAAKSARAVLDGLMAAGLVPTLVLLTELSSPPMTKAFKKLELAAARAAATAGETAPSRDEIEAARLKAAHKRDLQLSVRGVETLLQRALLDCSKIEFCGALQDLEDACRSPSRPQTAEKPAVDPSKTEDPEAPHPVLEPRVILTEHLGALARQALRKRKPVVDAAAAVPSGTPATADKGKSAPATDKKKSMVTAPAKGAVAPPPPADATPTEEEEEKIDVLPGLSLEMMAAQTLGHRLGKLSRYLIVNVFPSSWWESTLVYFAAPPPPLEASTPDVENVLREDVVPSAKHILVGPELSERFSTWHQHMQLDVTAPGAPPPIGAIVGGRGLERKLRLLDGLLERADRVYVVGELAGAIYRVLFTRSRIKEIKRDRKPVPQHEGRRLIAPVERLIQKAYRKQAELLLPFDLVVGDTHATFEWDDSTGAGDDEQDEDDEGEEDADEDEEDDDDDDDSPRKKRKTPRKQQKPLEEPLNFDSWQGRKSYEGEVAVVELDSSHWIRFSDVTCDTIRRARVVNGAAGVLDAPEVEDEPPTSTAFRPLLLTELEWTTRIFDVGPKSTQVLVEEFARADRGGYFWNGTLGVVECRDFEKATRQLVESIARDSQMRADLILVGGKSTSLWLRRLSQTPKLQQSQSVVGRDAKDAMVLPLVVEGKQHAMITAFDCA